MEAAISGTQLVFALVIGLAFLIYLILRTKIHSFLALIIAALGIGLMAGMDTNTIVSSISAGFGGTLGSIGIIIGFGVMMGEVFQLSGAAERMALTFIRLFGKGREEMALGLTGFIVSIPVFCDSGYVIISPITKALSIRTKKSIVALGASLAAGLVTTHSLVPPTPGPLGVAAQFGVDVGSLFMYGLPMCIIMVATALIYTSWLGGKIYQLPTSDGEGWVRPEVQEYTYERALEDTKQLPSAFISFMPLVVPIVLILCNTISKAAGKTDGIFNVLIFLGTPIIAVAIGLVISIYTLARDVSRKDLLEKMEHGIRTCGIILLVTGGGGALGKILQTSGVGNYVADQISALPIPIIVLPFLVATLIRFAQGSGTVAMITSASICAPIVHAAGGNMVLGALAASTGSLFFSYFNDSFFWVTNRLMGISDTKEMIRVWSFTTTILWATGFVLLMILNIFIG